MKPVNFWKPIKSKKKSKKIVKTPFFGMNVKPVKTPFFGMNVKPIVNSRLGIGIKPVHIVKKDLNWAQAKRVYPKLNPFGDADKDKVINKFDCRPFNKKKQGLAHRGHSRPTFEERIDKLLKSRRAIQKLTGEKFKSTGFRHMKKLGAYKYKGMYYYPDEEIYEHLDTIAKSKEIGGEKNVYYHGTNPGTAEEIKSSKHIRAGTITKNKFEAEGYAKKQAHFGGKTTLVKLETSKDYEGGTHVGKTYGKPELDFEDVEIITFDTPLEEQAKAKGMSKERAKQYVEHFTKLKNLDKEEDLYEKADEGTLTPKDIEEHELKSFNEDYDLKDEDDQTLDYDEEEEE